MGLELQLPELRRQADRARGDRPVQAARARRQPDVLGVPAVRPSSRGDDTGGARSADVVHGFYIPAFNFSRYALPGVTNNFDFTPVRTGVFAGHCAQYCGLYHAEMLFSVRVVKPGAFQAWLSAQSACGGGGMTLLADRPAVFEEGPAHEHAAGPSGFLKWVTSTDHKVIGKNYTVTAVHLLPPGGRHGDADPGAAGEPGQHLVVAAHLQRDVHDARQPDDLPVRRAVAFGGLANYIVPLQIGAPDMAFPRLNALSYWLYLGGGSLMMLGFLTTGSAADFGWVAYAPLSNSINTPGAGPDLWIVALILTGLFGHIHRGQPGHDDLLPRAPGMTMFRMPIFTWNMLVTGILILIAFPVFTERARAALVRPAPRGPYLRGLGWRRACLWQDLFWFFGHPEVYILALPFFGIVTDVIAVFSRKPIFGYRGMVFATMSIAALSTSVWAHHMFTTGVVLLPFFSLMSY